MVRDYYGSDLTRIGKYSSIEVQDGEVVGFPRSGGDGEVIDESEDVLLLPAFATSGREFQVIEAYLISDDAEPV